MEPEELQNTPLYRGCLARCRHAFSLVTAVSALHEGAMTVQEVGDHALDLLTDASVAQEMRAGSRPFMALVDTLVTYVAADAGQAAAAAHSSVPQVLEVLCQQHAALGAEQLEVFQQLVLLSLQHYHQQELTCGGEYFDAVEKFLEPVQRQEKDMLAFLVTLAGFEVSLLQMLALHQHNSLREQVQLRGGRLALM